ncbi:MAG: hypothetical protein PQJ61_14530 [Spirochaetales bacterium]|uniref:Uncharacterized protein n=1 Tax=Candidatus Thalassospirochaeta sargassi TaxID=3119039 RepID=A0AAJ1IHE7_9SPIO|nr:hypothetical protein [Spirochaetales bacterium]
MTNNYTEISKDELATLVAETQNSLSAMLEALEAKKTEGIKMGDRITILYGRGSVDKKDEVECIVHGLSLNGLYLQRIDGEKFGGRKIKEFSNKELHFAA